MTSCNEMIVEPDFLDHWKTRLLVKLTGDEAAPLMLLRLWGHCQYRKDWRFTGMNGETLSAICRSKIDGTQLLNVLNQSGFIEINGKVTVVHDWDVSNRTLVSAWRNGRFGGRPKKTQRKPDGNRPVTGREPDDHSINHSLSVLKEGVRGRFQQWVQIRKAMGKKPKDWSSMFLEQAEWLSKFSEADQIEILSASIRNNWQGLRAPARSGNNHRSMSAFEIEKRKGAIGEEITKIFKRNGSKRVPGDGIDELKRRRDELQQELVK